MIINIPADQGAMSVRSSRKAGVGGRGRKGTGEGRGCGDTVDEADRVEADHRHARHDGPARRHEAANHRRPEADRVEVNLPISAGCVRPLPQTCVPAAARFRLSLSPLSLSR